MVWRNKINAVQRVLTSSAPRDCGKKTSEIKLNLIDFDSGGMKARMGVGGGGEWKEFLWASKQQQQHRAISYVEGVRIMAFCWRDSLDKYFVVFFDSFFFAFCLFFALYLIGIVFMFIWMMYSADSWSAIQWRKCMQKHKFVWHSNGFVGVRLEAPGLLLANTLFSRIRVFVNDSGFFFYVLLYIQIVCAHTSVRVQCDTNKNPNK